ncbi:MAG TPA: sulfur carrier protein ThiS [Nitrospirales bacterium]|nr:sulfur carrier protein ThiS [Nitrospirales bacterium]HIB54664.1 sulfur carrier protein ThiS [Nitrospirales bacterium]HIC04034.1 sulfur carrier protein ThiS [Nitrospirales bacterium]HIN34116.1 sulfur carrier protein ThiS [Nitrospirales bacterium]HIO21881.1 sulfur carrier protein ThiS [Nitrospirales bacterium]
MDIIVNGEPRQVEQGLSVSGLLAQLGVSLNYLVVEQNGTIIPCDEFDSTTLNADDRVEVISFIGGGCGRDI